MKRKFTFLGIALLLAACGTDLGNLGDLGEILGSGGRDDSSVVRGTVNGIDTSARRIELAVSYVNNLRNEQSGSIYYDNDTAVEYSGRTYPVTSLERGDEIEAHGANVSGRYVADRIVVVRDVTR